MAKIDVLSLIQENAKSQFMAGASKSAQKADSVSKQFAQYMSQGNGQAGKFEVHNASPVEDKGELAAESYQKYRYQENTIAHSDKTLMQSKLEESSQELETFEKQIVEGIAEELGVSEEEVVKAMEALGITVFDLLEPQNLAELVMEITGIEDSAQLLFDASFQNLVQSVNELGTELKNSLGFDDEQMKTFLTLLEEVNGGTEAVAVFEDGELQQLLADTEALQQTVQKVVSNESEDVSKLLSRQITDSTEEGGNISQEAAAFRQSGLSGEMDNEAEMNFGQDMQEQSGEHTGTDKMVAVTGEQVQVMQVGTEAVPVDLEVPQDSYVSVDTVKMIEELAERVKMMHTQGETSLEMQLNPQNLGKLYLNVTSKQGVVNAHMVVTNELVKEALEAQVVQLRESLNQAGVKVDAVEVTVSAHEFERNLEQGQSREEQEGQQQEQNFSKNRRNLHISSLDELSGIMTEEEALAAQIMRDNGNSVDLTA